MRVWIVGALLALAACNQGAPQQGAAGAAGRPDLQAPAPDTDPARAFTPSNDAARAASGAHFTVSVVTQLADAAHPNATPTEVLSLRGDNGFAVDAQLTGTSDPSVTVQGSTLRALMGLNVEASQTLVYRVVNTHGDLCAAGAAPVNVVTWEPDGPGDPVFKVLPISGGAPGQPAARACPLLEYRRG